MDKEELNVVEEGSYKEIEYVVSWYRGHYCGYIKAEDNPYAQTDVHHEYTYGPDGDEWIGFDCNHLGDVCYNENGERSGRLSDIANPEERTEWYLEDVEEECKSAIEKMVGPQRRLERLDNDYKVELEEDELHEVVSNIQTLGDRLAEIQGEFETNVFTDDELVETHKKLHVARGKYKRLVGYLWSNRVKVDE